MLKNYMEDLIGEILPKVLKEYGDICKCERCITDIKAITLNQFYPLYIVSDKGNVYAKLNELQMQIHTDVVKEITKAIEIVCKNPRHCESNTDRE